MSARRVVRRLQPRRILVTSSEDKTARIWDAASAKETALARP